MLVILSSLLQRTHECIQRTTFVIRRKTHPHFFCPSDPQSCRNPNRCTSSEWSAWGCPNLRSAAAMISEKNVNVKVGKVGESVCSLGARKPTSEAELRDPGSSHLDWLYRSFMMRNKVTSSKCVLIFPAPPAGDNYFIGVGKTSLNIACLFIYLFSFLWRNHLCLTRKSRCVIGA